MNLPFLSQDVANLYLEGLDRQELLHLALTQKSFLPTLKRFVEKKRKEPNFCKYITQDGQLCNNRKQVFQEWRLLGVNVTDCQDYCYSPLRQLENWIPWFLYLKNTSSIMINNTLLDTARFDCNMIGIFIKKDTRFIRLDDRRGSLCITYRTSTSQKIDEQMYIQDFQDAIEMFQNRVKELKFDPLTTPLILRCKCISKMEPEEEFQEEEFVLESLAAPKKVNLPRLTFHTQVYEKRYIHGTAEYQMRDGVVTSITFSKYFDEIIITRCC